MSRRKLCILDNPQIRAAHLAALWAQRIGLSTNAVLWEAAIARNILTEFTSLGADASAWGLVETLWRIRLGLEAPEA